MDFSKTTSLPEIKSMGVCVFDPVWALEEHSSRNFELLYIVKGGERLTTRDGSFEATDGDVLVLPPMTPHRDEFDLGRELEVFMIHFSWPDGDAALRDAGPDSFSSLPEDVRNAVRRSLDETRSSPGFGGSSDLDRAVAESRLLTALLLLLGGGAPPSREASGASSHSRLIKRAKNYIERNYSEPFSLDDIAAELGVSPYHLSRVFSRESNFSLFEHLTQVRMMKAAALLSEGRMNVSEVAASVGYKDCAYFSKVFKKRLGKNPSDYHSN